MLADRGGCLVDDSVLGGAAVLEREVVSGEVELDARHPGCENAQRLLEQLLAGLVAFEDHDCLHRVDPMRAETMDSE